MKKIRKIIFSGVDIKRLNKFRKKYSKIKGGKLAKIIYPAKLVNLYFSDVIGDDFKVISSAPTYSKKADNILLLSNKICVKAMAERSTKMGLRSVVDTTRLKGEAKKVGIKLLKKAKKGVCLIAAGETTVKVKGDGKGGRNQELCLGSLNYIKKFDDCVLAGIASDGIDGVTDAAGVIIDNRTYYRSKKLGLDADAYLKENNSFGFFRKTGGLIYTGKTGINVMDFVIIIK